MSLATRLAALNAARSLLALNLLMLLEAVAYVSSARQRLSDEDLEALLLRARARNHSLGVTGVLLHHDGSFLQYFEGPAEGVRTVYDHIVRSPLHTGLIELLHAPIPQRTFGAWEMGFTRAPRSAFLQLANASWQQQLHAQRQAASRSDGLALRMQFWRTNGGHEEVRPPLPGQPNA